MARPTIYSEELLEKAREYITNYTTKIPTIEGLALALGINRDTVYAWSNEEDKQAFSDITRQIMSLQAQELIDKGLDGTFNPTITKLLLTKHGYSDKQDITSGGEKLPTPILGLNKEE